MVVWLAQTLTSGASLTLRHSPDGTILDCCCCSWIEQRPNGSDARAVFEFLDRCPSQSLIHPSDIRISSYQPTYTPSESVESTTAFFYSSLTSLSLPFFNTHQRLCPCSYCLDLSSTARIVVPTTPAKKTSSGCAASAQPKPSAISTGAIRGSATFLDTHRKSGASTSRATRTQWAGLVRPAVPDPNALPCLTALCLCCYRDRRKESAP